jgi:AAA domain
MPSKERRRLELIHFNEVTAGNRQRYLIRDMIPTQALILAYGEPKNGKSFWALDVGWHIAAGVEYHALKVMQGPVLYLPFEGDEGIRDRVELMRRVRGPLGGSFHVSWKHPTIEARTVKETLFSLVEDHGIEPRLIIIDTLNMSLKTGAKEKEENDIREYFQALQPAVRDLECSVMVIHHQGYEKGRPRGSSTIPATIDCQIRIEKGKLGGEEIVTSQVQLMKDGPEGEKYGSYLRSMSWDQLDREGNAEVIRSCVLEPVPPELLGRIREDTKDHVTSPEQSRGIKVARELHNGSGDISRKDWEDVFMRDSSTKSKNRKRSCDRSFTTLVKRGIFILVGTGTDRFRLSDDMVKGE